jgi:hypothetical protein
MMTLALTPTGFQEGALAWLGAVTVVVTALAGAAVVLTPKIANALAALKELRARQDRQDQRLNAQAQSLTKVALAVPPPAERKPDTGAGTAALFALLLPCVLLTSCVTIPSGAGDCESRRQRAAHLRTAADLIDCPEPRPLTQSSFAK